MMGVAVSMPAAPSIPGARMCVAAAAILWSLGSLFTRYLREPTVLGLNEPELSSLLIASYRRLLGGLAMLLAVRRTDLRFRPVLLGMLVRFAVRSGLYMSALRLGPAAH